MPLDYSIPQQYIIRSQRRQHILYPKPKRTAISFLTFLLIEQNLQSEADGGTIWLTISRFTGTDSFFKEACNLDDSLTAMTLGIETEHKKNQLEAIFHQVLPRYQLVR